MTAEITGVVTVPAPAKINLYFTITGRRSDGLHLVDSLVAFTTLGDEVTIRSGAPLQVTTSGTFAEKMPDPEKNLAYVAAQRLAEAAGVDPLADIHITKNLPVAAGIGGGSSDAAAVLRALPALWGLADGDVDLSAIGLTLGSDLPVCVFRKTAYASGIGEVLEDGPVLPPAGLLLVNPGVALVTASVYGARKGGFNPPERLQRDPKDAADLAKLLADLDNDLTPSASRLCPIIKDVLAALEATPGCHLARMTGSGATCFGIFDNKAAAEAAAPAVQRDGWWVAPTEIAV